MTAAASLAFPGGRTLAGWWRQLAPHHPDALWVGHLFLHHVEALARVSRPQPLAGFPLAVLRALALEGPGQHPDNNHAAAGAGPDRLAGRLSLEPPLVAQVLRGLAAQGLARVDAQGRWSLTEAGAAAARSGECRHEGRERRIFHFVEGKNSEGTSAAPPFLALAGHVAAPWEPGEGWAFDLGLVRACVGQPPDWKQRRDFPPEVEDVLGPGEPAEGVPAWERVIVDRPEHLVAAVVRAPGPGGERWLRGFAVRQEGWAVQADEVLFSLPESSAGVLTGLRPEQPTDAWREAWKQWCQQRALPASEASASRLELEGVSLKVRLPARLLDRLRAARSDALKGEAWVLAGGGPFRNAARLDVSAL